MNPMSMLRPLAALTLGAGLAAAQGAPAPKAQAAPPSEPAPPRPDGLKSRLFLLQYRAPDFRLVDLLRPLGSGNYWAGITATDRDGLKAITVRDFPENIAAIEDALKRLDVPVQAHKQVEFHIQVLFASKQEGQGAVPDELQDVLASLRSTLAFKSYTPVATFVQRAADGADAVEGEGQAEMAVRTSKGDAQQVPMDIQWGIYHLSVASAATGTPFTISFPKFQLMAWEHVGAGHGGRLASIETNLTMKDGEKVVVGTSMIRDKALVVVVTAKVVD